MGSLTLLGSFILTIKRWNIKINKKRCRGTKDLLWGRSQGVNMEIFKYDSSSDGITISKRIAYPQPQKDE